MDNKIKQALIDQVGWIYSTQENPIEWFSVNGEMYLVAWRLLKQTEN